MLTTKSVGIRAVLLSAIALVVLQAAPAEAQTTLRWKFKQGEKLTYVSEQVTMSKGSFAGMEFETSMNQTTDMTWVVKSVGSDGVAELSQTIDRIRMKMELPMLGEIAYDSKDGKQIEGPFGESLGQVFGAMTGAEMMVKMDPTGEIRDVKLPEKLLSSLRDQPGLAQFGSMFSEDGFKQMTQGGAGSVGAFPKNPVSKGETWEKKAEMKTPFGTISVVTTSTYAGPETREGSKAEKIDLKINQTVEPAPGSMIDIKITSQESKGAAFFDNTQGRLVAQEVKQKMKMALEVMGNVIEQDVDTTMTMKLTPDAKKSN